jgi:hypothetical protein
MPNRPSYPIKERLHALAAFLPLFEKGDFVLGHWEHPKSDKPNTIMLPYFVYNDVANSFINMTYEMGWIMTDFSWSAWKETKEATDLRDQPDLVAKATPTQLGRLLTVVIRQDRFCEGSIDAAHESGLLLGIIMRAAKLESE